MTSLLAQRLEASGALPAEDVALLDSLSTQGRRYAANTEIIVEGDAPGDVHLVTKGFAYRYKF